MWGYLKNLALRTALTLACLALLTANNPNRSPHVTATLTVAAAAKPEAEPPAAATIAMVVAATPPLESRLPRGKITLANAEVDVSREPVAAKAAAEPTEILLLQAIIAQAEVGSQRQGGPARSSGSGGSRRGPDPDLPPEFDPNYDNWQKDADIKLNDEKSRASGKDHPLATANPDSYLVICLGGCRPSSDQIVYRVSRTAAAAAVIAQRRMETTATDAASGMKPEESDQNAVACIAGCYANHDVSPELKPRRADATPDARPNARVIQVAKLAPASITKPDFVSTSAHSISAETRGYIARKSTKSAINAANGWRTKIGFATKKAARLAARLDQKKRVSVRGIARGRSAKRSTIVTEASGFIF